MPFRLRFIPLLLCLTATASGVERVVLKQDGERHTVTGRLLVTAEDGGMLIIGPDGTLWNPSPEDIISHEHDDEPMQALSADEQGRQLLAELPDGFEIHHTQHYVICYNTSRGYAQWCGSLFERLYKAFNNFWSRRGFRLHDSEFPLVALVFGDQKSYADYVRRELTGGAGSIVGCYSLRSNRMMMYDLTGVETLRRPGDRRANPAQIEQMLSRPEAEHMVATVVHEATHQIAFNCGLQTRYADMPLWFSEGLAIYFETPDLNSAKGWRTIGAVNHGRLATFREYQRKSRPADSLTTLLASDDRMRDSEQAVNAYAEAWALNYFLLRQRPKQYLAYVKRLSEKTPLIWDDAEGRLREFRQAFGDLQALDADFVKQTNKLR
ncbi:MAG TPA: DUF1570 domain-containing protein [Pirellulales bacterium]|nr:DUF1570 domain-containing protein [Pirellulales bacterium]